MVSDTGNVNSVPSSTALTAPQATTDMAHLPTGFNTTAAPIFSISPPSLSSNPNSFLTSLSQSAAFSSTSSNMAASPITLPKTISSDPSFPHALSLLRHLLSPTLNLSPKDIALLLSSTPPLSEAIPHPQSAAASHPHEGPPHALINPPPPAMNFFPHPNSFSLPTYHIEPPSSAENPTPHSPNSTCYHMSVAAPLSHHGGAVTSPLSSHFSSHVYHSSSSTHAAPYTPSHHLPVSHAVNPFPTSHSSSHALPPSTLPNLMSMKLNGDNYLLWKSQFDKILRSHDI